jgi:hypothetical protein
MRLLKQLFVLLFKLIAEPAPTWEALYKKREIDNEHFYQTYQFPIFGLIALCAFIGGIWDAGHFDVQWGLKSVVKNLLVYGVSFYLIPYILSVQVFPRYKLPKDKLIAERFYGYSSSLIYVVAMLYALFPSMFFLTLLMVYTVYIVWVGAAQFLRLKEEVLMKFTLTAGAVIILFPYIIQAILGMLMPGMKD